MDNKKIKLITLNNNIIGLEFNGLSFERANEETELEFVNRAKREIETKQNINFRQYFTKENIIKEELNVKEVKKVESKKEASSNLKKKVIAGVLIATLALGALGLSTGTIQKWWDKVFGAKQEQRQEKQYTENAELNEVLNKIAEYEDGEQIVERILSYDKFQKDFNERMLKNKDKNGNSVYLKAEEVAAVDAIANATNIDVPLTLDKDLVICNYLEAGKASTDAMFASNEKTGFKKFIVDKKVKSEYALIEDSVEKVLNKENNANTNCKNAFATLYKTPETYPEATALSAYDGNLTIAGLKGAISGSTITEYQNRTKTDNAILNYCLNYISAKENENKDLYKLTLKAYSIMNKENIKVDLKTRELFDASVTPEGIAKEQKLLNEKSTTTVKKQETTKKQQVTKQEAVDKFGKEEVKKAEDKAEENTYVDTNDDGKKDTTLKDAQEESKKEEQALKEEAQGWEDGWAAGRKDGLANKSSNSSCSGSEAYQKGYKEGYAQGYENGQKQYNAMQKAMNEEKEVKTVTGVLRDGTEYSSTITEEQPKEMSRGAVL